VPSWVGAAGTPVLPGELRTVCPLCQRVSDWGTLECPRFGGQLSAGLSGLAERLFGHAKEAEVPEAVPA
jgi:hypothetical protein